MVGATGGGEGEENEKKIPEINREDKTPGVKFFLLCCCPVYFLLCCTLADYVKSHILPSIAVSTAGYFATLRLVPPFAERLAKRGLSGRDLHKPWQPQPVAESLGLIAALSYLVCVISTQLLVSTDPSNLLEYNSALVAVTFMTFLGFLDDVLDLRWRYKLTLPSVAALPVVLAYQGPTAVLLPSVAWRWLPQWVHLHCKTVYGLLELGILYRIYMVLLTIFCSNAINIYAGVNGLEVGQSLVMCFFVMAENVVSVLRSVGDPVVRQSHLFSLIFSIPFFSCSAALMYFNAYPARVFVGDTYTYFAGVFFAMVAILGHFSKTMLLLFIPQLLNFAISLPQLLRLVHCPRHRVPRVNEETRLLQATPNLTLLNVALRIFGPMREDALCYYLLGFQVVACCGALTVKHVIFAS